MPFPVLMDPKGKVARSYGVRGTPAHFLIDQEGDIRGFAIGYKDWKNKKIHDLIQFLIDQNSEK
jgi:peroxiredoxin